eukprot:TRINITY_DN9106_c0_g1_i1.p1 TRINITY_DN9106_c0_g1~~TRINITY_DN9106_c0_g1_i1.p1  ORF type:complete len:207 (-),score=59.55 TRINITY_DN9106_c0_g1_i1:478-1098(-)
MSAENVVVTTHDGGSHTVARSTIKKFSEVLNGMIEDVEGEVSVPLPDTIDAETFGLVIEYMTHYAVAEPAKELEKPIRDDLRTLLNDFDKNYVYERLYKNGADDHVLMFAVLRAANFLGISPLMDLCCAVAATTLWAVREEPEKMMKILGCEGGPFTPEEEAEMERQYPWIKEEAEGDWTPDKAADAAEKAAAAVMAEMEAEKEKA